MSSGEEDFAGVATGKASVFGQRIVLAAVVQMLTVAEHLILSKAISV